MVTSKSDRGQRMQVNSTEPVVEDDTLPTMAAIDEIAAMDQDNVDGPVMSDESNARQEPDKGRRMKAFDASHAERQDAQPPRPEQEEEPRRYPDEGYVRLDLAAVDGRLHVLARREVEGPLSMPTRIRPGWVYEVRLREERVGLGLIADFGETRGFADPQGREGMDGHHLSSPKEPRIAVRVNRNALGDASIEDLSIVLYRVERVPDDEIGPEPLAERFPEQLRPIAELGGRVSLE